MDLCCCRTTITARCTVLPTDRRSASPTDSRARIFCPGRAGLVVIAWLAGTIPTLAADVSEKLVSCLACHGEKGQSQIENVPSIGAQTTHYSLIQLFMYREKMRVADAMNDAAKELSDAELQSMADALAALPPPAPPNDLGDPAPLDRA